MSRADRRARRERKRRLAELPWHRPFVVVGPDEAAVHVPGAGAIFISVAHGFTIVEAAAISGPGVADRKAILEAKCRELGFADAIEAAKRRAEMAA